MSFFRNRNALVTVSPSPSTYIVSDIIVAFTPAPTPHSRSSLSYTRGCVIYCHSKFIWSKILGYADYNMYSTFLTASPGSVLFGRSNLLKRKDLCFSCLRLGLISLSLHLYSPFLKCPWSIIDLFRILRLFILTYFHQFQISNCLFQFFLSVSVTLMNPIKRQSEIAARR
jgi:hypothetical protein